MFLRGLTSSFLSSASPNLSSATPSPAVASCLNPTRMATAGRSIRIAVVGDVHDDWDLEEDAKALHFLQADLVLFTGMFTLPGCDFGDENVDLVESVAKLEIPKAVILGNHDAWRTVEFAQKKKDGVRLQLELLKEQHVGFRQMEIPSLELSIVGGRPFSCGGDRIFRQRLLSSKYGVRDMEDSTKKIYEAATGTSKGYPVVFLAHNGPTGLGSKVDDICGRDWIYGGGDHGDPDLAKALSYLKRTTHISIPLVVFGHMHKELAYRRGLRKMIVVGNDNTVYLNGAIVPRVKSFQEQVTCSGSSQSSESHTEAPNNKNGTLRAFTLVEIQERSIKKISEIWVSVLGGNSEIAEENILYETSQMDSKSLI